jgi:cytochrome c-type biogenesis protein CcmE
MATWEKTASTSIAPQRSNERIKFLIGGALILVAVGYLIISGTIAGARYYITVDELLANPDYVGQTVRISGAVIGETIAFNSDNQVIEFEIANVPENYTDLGLALHEAAINPNAQRIAVRIEGQPMPDLLQHEAQAILTGTFGADGVFHATELLLKCPTRMGEATPEF